MFRKEDQGLSQVWALSCLPQVLFIQKPQQHPWSLISEFVGLHLTLPHYCQEAELHLSVGPVSVQQWHRLSIRSRSVSCYPRVEFCYIHSREQQQWPPVLLEGSSNDLVKQATHQHSGAFLQTQMLKLDLQKTLNFLTWFSILLLNIQSIKYLYSQYCFILLKQ